MRNTLLATVAALVFVPSLARAEFATRNVGDVRAPSAKHAKVEHSPTRVGLVTAPRLTVDEVIGKINGQYMPAIQRCYRKSLVADPTLSGKVTLSFQVDNAGHVLMDSGPQQFEQCLSRAVAGWRFSPPANQAESQYRIGLVLASY